MGKAKFLNGVFLLHVNIAPYKGKNVDYFILSAFLYFRLHSLETVVPSVNVLQFQSVLTQC